MLTRLSSGLEAGRGEARQMLRRASSRFNVLLGGYRSLSVHSDDLDRHEYGARLPKPFQCTGMLAIHFLVLCFSQMLHGSYILHLHGPYQCLLS